MLIYDKMETLEDLYVVKVRFAFYVNYLFKTINLLSLKQFSD